MTEPISYYPGDILRETLREIYETLGKRIESIALERVVTAPSLTGVKLNNGSGGLCSNQRGGDEELQAPVKDLRLPAPTGRSREKKIIDCINDSFGSIPSKKAVGIAIVNALSATCSRLVPPTGYGVKAGMSFPDRAVLGDATYTVVSGDLEPVINSLRKAGRPFGILGGDRSWPKKELERWYIEPEMVTKRVSQADLLILAGTTLMDDSLEYLLSLRRKGAGVFVSGPAASMLPAAFFRRGVSALHGLVIADPEAALDAIVDSGWDGIFFGKGIQKVVIQPGQTRLERVAPQRYEGKRPAERSVLASPGR